MQNQQHSRRKPSQLASLSDVLAKAASAVAVPGKALSIVQTGSEMFKKTVSADGRTGTWTGGGCAMTVGNPPKSI